MVDAGGDYYLLSVGGRHLRLSRAGGWQLGLSLFVVIFVVTSGVFIVITPGGGCWWMLVIVASDGDLWW